MKKMKKILVALCLISNFSFAITPYDIGLKHAFIVEKDELDIKINYTLETIARFEDQNYFLKEGRRESYISYWTAHIDFLIDCKKMIEEKYSDQAAK